ncbi:TetR/AcrR family transcriptional regulator [Lacticaseibacillus zeae]|uniref:TetR/AcrR family transcriptional regulator n=1 Tax=Lacticaseibacillus zeae subsp. silagei TaxID=3068307 RepID=A0ABD7Z7X3_LACZE|nr:MULTISPECIES: TetR/AcrR family transcriptional regulator [Lacticaseibacillus]MDE3316125.1 TetR/AcrR family transcriptional regulator [Lacticaseibacillus zeae]OFR93420.1 TetR family transcriptional regulator [Lactobacillus sp. HMSC068F07]WLV83161.1 TetR/AcrR family transcriptional regulator [Lacticaseibacillus sp. NCIMB 15475]WLV85910.1 TetR/AcrR family transcriptional regulator [Lacticaseibacillus sp. NCIMB 15474]
MNQREQRKKATIARILAAAQTLFMTNGYASVTTRMIAEASNVQQPLLYHYFGTKEKLYLAVVMQVSDTMAAKIASTQTGSGSLAAKVNHLGHVLTDDNDMNLQMVIHDIANLKASARGRVFKAWQDSLLAPLDRFFAGFQSELLEVYQPREVTLYFLNVLAVYLRPANTAENGGFQQQLPLDRALQMFCTGVSRTEEEK